MSGYDVAGRSHRGKVREQNEDAWLTLPEDGLFAVIDGMGGARAGARAAAITRDVLAGHRPRNTADLRRAYEAAHESLRGHAEQHPEDAGLGCVATTALVRGARLTLAHVGDTRAYLASKAGCQQLTRDHTVVAEIQERHAMTEADADALPGKHRVTRDLGSGAGTRGAAWVDLVDGAIDVNDILLLASDGLTDLVDDGEIARMLGRARVEADSSLERLAERFIELSLERGAHDNTTVVLVRRLHHASFDDTETVSLPVPYRREQGVQVASDAEDSGMHAVLRWLPGILVGALLGFGAAVWSPWSVERARQVGLVEGSDPAAIIDAARLGGRFEAPAALTALGPLAIADAALETTIAAETRVELRGLDLRFPTDDATWTITIGDGGALVLRQASIRAEKLQLRLILGTGARVRFHDSHLAIAGLEARGSTDAIVLRSGGRVDLATPANLAGPTWVDEDTPVDSPTTTDPATATDSATVTDPEGAAVDAAAVDAAADDSGGR